MTARNGAGTGCRVRLMYADGTTSTRELVVCDTPLSRMVGMLKERTPGISRVYQIVPCNGVHTCFMAFAIDVVFTDRSGDVVAARTVPPWRMFSRTAAHMVFEGVGLLREEVVLERLQVE